MIRFTAIALLASALPLFAQDSRESLKPPRPSEARVQELMDQFESRAFVEREKAHRTLRNLGFHHPDAVLEAMAERWFSAGNEETSYRLYSCLFNIKHDLYYKDPIGFVGISMLGAEVPVGNRRRACILIREVVPGTAAERSNLQINDRILSVDGLTFDGLPTRTNFFSEYVRSKRPGEKIELEVVRGAEIFTITVELGERPRKYRLIWQDRIALQNDFSKWLDEQRKRLGLTEPEDEKDDAAEPDSPPENDDSPGR